MRLPGGLASEGVPYYSVYWVLGAHLPYRPRSLRRISPRLVHGFPRCTSGSSDQQTRTHRAGPTVMKGAGVGEGSLLPSSVTPHRPVMIGNAGLIWPRCDCLIWPHP